MSTKMSKCADISFWLFNQQLGLAKSLFVNENTTAVHKSVQIIEWVQLASGTTQPERYDLLLDAFFWCMSSVFKDTVEPERAEFYQKE